ncbi:MAG TPA: hypothetical protein VJ847_00930 [Gemmatimonadales bacterium]|nr:hypothetical protein [Gemmatimonadales bacterium]
MRAALVAGAILGVAACGGRTAGPAAAPPQAAAITALREATRPYHDVAAAVRSGYAAEVPACIVHEHHGAMGYHHINRSYITRDLAVERPQFLLYERLPGGDYRLNGVEFFIPYRLWPRDSTRPMFLGQQLKREDTFQYWYLHVWAWRENPEGMFADFNPVVRCPAAASKVYRPNPPAGF